MRTHAGESREDDSTRQTQPDLTGDCITNEICFRQFGGTRCAKWERHFQAAAHGCVGKLTLDSMCCMVGGAIVVTMVASAASGLLTISVPISVPVSVPRSTAFINTLQCLT